MPKNSIKDCQVEIITAVRYPNFENNFYEMNVK